MNEINWEEVAEEADNSPRSILAECLAKADEIEDIVILWRDKEQTQHCSFAAASMERGIAMMELAKFNWLLDAKREGGEL